MEGSMVAQSAKASTNISTQGEWLARDGKSWVVRVPTAGGHKTFPFDAHGGINKALLVARAFHVAMDRQYKNDLEYFKKNGERIQRLHSNNTSGVNGVSRLVYPRLDGSANIVYRAYFTRRDTNIHFTKDFSTYEHVDEKTSLAKATKQRKKWEKQYMKLSACLEIMTYFEKILRYASRNKI